eukprot:sb/3473893/
MALFPTFLENHDASVAGQDIVVNQAQQFITRFKTCAENTWFRHSLWGTDNHFSSRSVEELGKFHMELENDIGTPIVDVAAGPLSRCSTCNLVVEGQLKREKHTKSHQPTSTMEPVPSVAATWRRPTTPPDLSQLKLLSTYPTQVG